MFYFPIQDNAQLRLLLPSHAPELFTLVDQNRKHLRQWLPWVDNVKRYNDSEVFIKGALDDFAHQNGWQAGIFAGEKIVGCIGYHKFDRANRKTSLGYWISKEYEGKGLVGASTHALVNYAIKDLGFHRVEIHCATENLKSQRIPERLGFEHEGTQKESEWLYDHYVDHNVYVMLENRWKQANP